MLRREEAEVEAGEGCGGVVRAFFADDGVAAADVFEADFAELGLADEDGDGVLGVDAEVGDGEGVVFLQLLIERLVVAFAEGDEGGFILAETTSRRQR